MALHNPFQKKKPAAQEPAPAPHQDTEGAPALLEPSLDLPEILAILAEKCPGGELHGEWLQYKAHDLAVKVEFGQMQSVNDMYNVQLLLIAQHPFFDEELVESVAGIGPTPDDAIRAGADNICIGVLPCILGAFGCTNDEWIETDLMGEMHRFRIPCERGNIHAGSADATDLWKLVKDTVPAYLGTKRCYWIKLFSACVNGIPQCEIRVNGAVCNELTDRLYADAVKHKDVPGYIADKAFVMLVQDEATYTPCPFTKQEVGEAAFRAFRLLQGIHDEESAKTAMQTIRQSVPHHSLGIELVSFLPEIVAQMTVQFRDSDGLLPVVNRGKPDRELKKTQVRSYGYIEDAVFQYLRKQQPSEEEIRQVLSVSSKFYALAEALENGTKLEDLRFSQLVYFVDEAYRVW